MQGSFQLQCSLGHGAVGALVLTNVIAREGLPSSATAPQGRHGPGRSRREKEIWTAILETRHKGLHRRFARRNRKTDAGTAPSCRQHTRRTSSNRNYRARSRPRVTQFRWAIAPPALNRLEYCQRNPAWLPFVRGEVPALDAQALATTRIPTTKHDSETS